MNSPVAQLFQLFDVRNIQVLRGPEGGVGGRNATAGSIRIDSVEPDGEFSAIGNFSYGNFNSGVPYVKARFESAARRGRVDPRRVAARRPLPKSALRRMLSGLRRWIGARRNPIK